MTVADEPTPPVSQASELIKAAGAVIAGLGGAVGLILAVGVAVITGRALTTTGASVLDAVPQLPSNVLVSYGVEVAAFPVVVALAYLLIRAFGNGKPPKAHENPAEAPDRNYRTRWYLFLSLVVIGPALGFWLYAACSRLSLGGAAAAGVAVGGLIALGVIGFGITWLTSALLDRLWEQQLSSYAREAAGAILVGLAVFPGSLFAIGSLPLQKAIVCTTGGRLWYPTYLIGSGSGGTFVVDKASGAVLSLASGDVVRIWSGPYIWKKGKPFVNGTAKSRVRCEPAGKSGS